MSSPLTLALLKTPWMAFGITAPRFIWLAALLIFAGTLACLIRLWWLVRREERLYHRIRTQLTSLQSTDGVPQRDGMASTMYQAMAQMFNQLASEASPLVSAWRRFDTQMVVRRDPMGQDRFWTAESAKEAFNDTTVIEPRLNRRFFYRHSRRGDRGRVALYISGYSPCLTRRHPGKRAVPRAGHVN